MKGYKIIRFLLILVVLLGFGYFIFYYWICAGSSKKFQELSDLKEKDNTVIDVYQTTPKDEEEEDLPILSEYQALYNKNKNLIGWVKIADTSIDYPVMKSLNGNGNYYLTHNFEQQEDKNGTIFMDDLCDPILPSDNLILYGHNMKSGKMFGDLDLYKSKSFYKEHKTVNFDTIYKAGSYEVVFVFQAKIYSEAEITFKYYQFITPNSKEEFDSGVREMKKQSLYDTGIDVEYGDELLTLSTCDYDEEDGRFVVVCKRMK